LRALQLTTYNPNLTHRSPNKLSLNYFDAEDALRGDDTIIAKGYTASVVSYLYAALTSKGGKVVLSSPVTSIAYNAATGVTVSF